MAHVTVFKTDDPLKAQMLTDLLQQEGVPARLLGTRHGASIGVGQNIIRMRIEVPAEDVARAAELVAVWENAAPATPEDADEVADREEAEEEARMPARSRKSHILAAGVSFIIPGGGHFYTRRPWTGALIAVGIITGLIGLGQTSRVGASAAALALVGLVLADLILGQRAVSAFNRGGESQLPGATRQLLAGATALFVAGGVGVLVAPHLPQTRRHSIQSPGPDRLERPRVPGQTTIGR